MKLRRIISDFGETSQLEVKEESIDITYDIGTVKLEENHDNSYFIIEEQNSEDSQKRELEEEKMGWENEKLSWSNRKRKFHADRRNWEDDVKSWLNKKPRWNETLGEISTGETPIEIPTKSIPNSLGNIPSTSKVCEIPAEIRRRPAIISQGFFCKP
ncbi:unnamed protein product [Orchesella dallaii]|uniref:Uncharacterized protein n=1 Tax=Orchesella dallaii TaxID=48710 RepID=A0ABP1RV02_9HEXA